MNVRQIEHCEPDYPMVLGDRLADAAPRCLHALGNTTILQHRLLGLICSIQCPGSVVIKTFDVIRELRDAGVVVIGGFHSPMERECLGILLRGDQPVILCAARGLPGLRIGQEARRAVKAGRLFLLSPFGSEIRRTNSSQAVIRNEIVAAMADAVLVPHASPGGKVETAARRAIGRAQPVFTLADEQNAALTALGAKPFDGIAPRLLLGQTATSSTKTVSMKGEM